MTDPKVTLQTALDLGLTEEEFDRIVGIMGRFPNITELNIFSVMWSDPCSNKNSIFWLRTLPREGKRMLVHEEEENAGLVEIGDGMTCVFNIGSHKYPAAGEVGRSAGAGDIHRNIFTLGARPVAALHSLRFSNADDAPYNRHLIKEVVSGIGHYGHCLGVPTVGSEVYFDDSFSQHFLVNTLSAGIARTGMTVQAVASGIGNPVFLAGGISGEDMNGKTGLAVDLPVAKSSGAPDREKRLLEATLEVIPTEGVVGMKNLGVGGIPQAAAEMSARGGAGMIIDLDKVPAGREGMRAFELLLSGNRERILIVGNKGMEKVLQEAFQKQGLICQQIGEVSDTGRLEFFRQGEKIADVPVFSLISGGGAPVNEMTISKPAYLKKIAMFRSAGVPDKKNYLEIARKIVASPNIASRKWLFEQHDPSIQARPGYTSPASDAAVVPLKEANKALVLTAGCNPVYVFADPYSGTMMAVAEAARTIVCSGGVPAAVTKSLNFGNPLDPEGYWQFVQSIKGLGEACKKFDTPVMGGEVNFYPPSPTSGRTEPPFPTPLIGMLGIMENINDQMPLGFTTAHHQIYMIGTPTNDLGSSAYLRLIHCETLSPAPKFDLDEEYHMQQNLQTLIRKRKIQSAHDISEGGLFVALLEAAMVNGLGFNIETDENFRKDAYLFGEAQSRVVVSVTLENEDDLVNLLNAHNVSFTKLGEVAGDRIVIDEEDFGPIAEWKAIYENTLKEKLGL